MNVTIQMKNSGHIAIKGHKSSFSHAA